MFLQKNKKGFTLIELMVVVAIIGILALLGLRVYSGQQEKARMAITKANAGTAQTLIQSEFADGVLDDVDEALTVIAKGKLENPYSGAAVVKEGKVPGAVLVTEAPTSEAPKGTKFYFEALDKDGNAIAGYKLSAER